MLSFSLGTLNLFLDPTDLLLNLPLCPLHFSLSLLLGTLNLALDPGDLLLNLPLRALDFLLGLSLCPADFLLDLAGFGLSFPLLFPLLFGLAFAFLVGPATARVLGPIPLLGGFPGRDPDPGTSGSSDARRGLWRCFGPGWRSGCQT